MKTRNRIANAFVSSEPYTFTRKKVAYRVDWSITPNADWFGWTLKQRTPDGNWHTIYLEGHIRTMKDLLTTIATHVDSI